MTPNPNPYEGDSFLRTMPLLTPEEHEAVRQKYRDFIKVGRARCRRCKRTVHRDSRCNVHVRTCLTCCYRTYPNPTHPLPEEAS